MLNQVLMREAAALGVDAMLNPQALQTSGGWSHRWGAPPSWAPRSNSR
ncbi:hypothetical protein [Kitasatospora indigofera]